MKSWSYMLILLGCFSVNWSIYCHNGRIVTLIVSLQEICCNSSDEGQKTVNIV